MKRLLISALAAASLTAVVTPAFAQPYRGDDYRYGDRYDRFDRGDWGNLNAREAELRRRIDRGAARGDLTRWEARQLRHELDSIEYREQRFRSNGYRGRAGLSDSERADISHRLDILSQKIDRAMRDDDRRWDRRY